MPFSESYGRSIYYEVTGSGPAVLFCHGAGSNGATWWQQLPEFRRKHTCITMDVRCFGRSVAPLSEFDLRLFVGDVLSILDHERVDDVAFVGQSLGGMIGFSLALDHPQRVRAFVACDTSLAVDHPELIRVITTRLSTMKAVSIEQRSLGPWFLQNCPDKALLYAQINHFNPSAYALNADDWGRAIASLTLKERLVPLSRLTELRCPTLFLVGSEDPIVSVSVTQELASMVASSEVVVIEQAGHSAYFEKPAEFNATVLSFLDRRTASANAAP